MKLKDKVAIVTGAGSGKVIRKVLASAINLEELRLAGYL